MARDTSQRLKLFYLRKILLDKTDDVYEDDKILRGQSILNWIKNSNFEIY